MIPGLQVSSFKHVLTTEDEVRTAFRRIHDMGCSTVQLQWIDPSVSIPFIADMLREYALTSVSTQDFFQSIERDPQYYLRLTQETGSSYLCVSRIPQEYRTREGLIRYTEELSRLRDVYAPLGIQVCFHPTAQDYVPCPEGAEPGLPAPHRTLVDYLCHHLLSQ